MAKDWTGTPRSKWLALGASNHTDKDREVDDFYATDPVAIDLLLGYKGVQLSEWVWEPSCGSGCLSERLREHGHEVISTDLVYRGYGDGGVNFFDQREMPDPRCRAIVTNPPYKYATEYVLHALDLLPSGGVLCLFLKTTFAEGKERYQRIFGMQPPRFVLQCSERVLCARNAEFDYMLEHGGSAVSYAWWVWQKGYQGPTTLDWINHPSPCTARQLTLL